MLSNIKTSKANKEVVSSLTNKLGLGAENTIARIAFASSLSTDKVLNLIDIKDAGGKEYSAKVLFGDYLDYYIALICLHYNIYNTDKDIPRYIKMHVDDGLELLNREFQNNYNTTGFEFIASKINQI
ncbi:DNA sulfur modification protein DndE [Pelobium manganitolerans]|uniref:DNA sulfur modification protein DndE n=1 Tax=Pelobium manganitolerans TaxID=1842495 RepID=A0A419S1V6_9SPHI|nr:DndE family protein [Pelobium manganitolerans]RKD12478.1 DNA sulfur modification protein DndE [Pelobium manganitolerans]